MFNAGLGMMEGTALSFALSLWSLWSKKRFTKFMLFALILSQKRDHLSTFKKPPYRFLLQIIYLHRSTADQIIFGVNDLNDSAESRLVSLKYC